VTSITSSDALLTPPDTGTQEILGAFAGCGGARLHRRCDFFQANNPALIQGISSGGEKVFQPWTQRRRDTPPGSRIN
jgi:hypothetical protein